MTVEPLPASRLADCPTTGRSPRVRLVDAVELPSLRSPSVLLVRDPLPPLEREPSPEGAGADGAGAECGAGDRPTAAPPDPPPPRVLCAAAGELMAAAKTVTKPIR